MAQPTFACPKCATVFRGEPGTAHIESECPQCFSHLDFYFYPAFYRPVLTGIGAVSLVDASQASCFYHPTKQAVHVCDGCGRMVCALCSIDLAEQHLCPACLSSGKKKGKLTLLEQSRTRWDSLALSLALIGIILAFLSFLTGPAAIYIAIRHWNSPSSLVPTNKAKFIIAIALALVEILFWAIMVAVMIAAPAHHVANHG